MANHKSSLKRIRSNAAKRLRNRYQAKTTRNAIKKLRGTTTKVEASELLTKVISMLDRLAKKNVIHKNKASNNKSKLTKFVNTLKEPFALKILKGMMPRYYPFFVFVLFPNLST